MMCVICISRGGSAAVSFSEVEERAVDLRKVSTVLSQSEPTRYVRQPNITGEAGVTMSWSAGDPNGCLAFGSKKHGGASGSDTSGRYLVLDASKASSIFGNGSSVQPSSLRLLPCIKV